MPTYSIALTFASVDALDRYWTVGEGGVKRVRWGTDGSMKRCIRLMRKYFPADPGGRCANLHKRATGEWPAEELIDS